MSLHCTESEAASATSTWSLYNHFDSLSKAQKACFAADVYDASGGSLKIGPLARLCGVSKPYVYAAINLPTDVRAAVCRKERPLVSPKVIPWEARLEKLESEVGLDALFHRLQWRKAMRVPSFVFESDCVSAA